MENSYHAQRRAGESPLITQRSQVSNPVPATSRNDPRATSGVIFMPLVNGFVNISLC
jgi:hypothetical protein